MAIRYSNATRHMPTSGTRSNGATPGNLGQGDPVNGYPFGSTTPGYIDYRDPSVNGAFYPGTTRQRYQDDPNARKVHTPGSSRGQRTGFWDHFTPTPDPITHPEFYVGGTTPEQDAARAQAADARIAAKRAQYMQNPGYSGALERLKGLGFDPYSRDPKQQMRAKFAQSGKIDDPELAAALQEFGYQIQAARSPGLTRETWDNRFSQDWPKPRSPLGGYSHGPGRPDWDTRFTNPPPPNTIGGGVRRGATPQVNAPMSAGAPPSQNPMFQGYLGGGAGTVSGGQGGQFGGLQNWMAQAGGYNPGASTGSAGLYNDASLYDSPMAAQGRTAPWQGTAPGGRQPIGPFNPTIDPSTRPGSAPSWASAQPGYAPFNPGNFSMPYDTGGMWQMFGGSPMGGGMNYAQMQNYLGLQPQGAPNWIGL